MKYSIIASVASLAVISAAQAQYVVISGWDFDTNDLSAQFDSSITLNLPDTVPNALQASDNGVINTSALYQAQDTYLLTLEEGTFELEYSNFNHQQVNVMPDGGNPPPLDSGNLLFSTGFEPEPANNNGILLFRGRNSGNVLWDDFGVMGPERGKHFDMIVSFSNFENVFLTYDVAVGTNDWKQINNVSISVNGGAFNSIFSDNLTGLPLNTWVQRNIDLSAYDQAANVVVRYTFETTETADDDSPFGLLFDNIGFFGEVNVIEPIIPEPSTVAALLGLGLLGLMIVRRRR